jgi:hypothetical protein
MGGFFRKVAGAFIYLDEEAKNAQPRADEGQLDHVALDASELINQLGHAAAPAPEAGGASPEALPPPPSGSSTMELTADQVFAAAALADGPNSAQRVLKIIAGLAMFPKEQQAVMVRAMDAADESWSEKEVLDDARRRQASLRNHIQAIEAEKTERLQWVAANAQSAEAEGRRSLETIDRQLAELQQLRAQTIASTTSALGELEHQRKQVEESAEKARRGITTVINALSELITFFTGSEPRAPGKS